MPAEYNHEGRRCKDCGASLYPDGTCSDGCDDEEFWEDYYIDEWERGPDPDAGRDEPPHDEYWEDQDAQGHY